MLTLCLDHTLTIHFNHDAYNTLPMQEVYYVYLHKFENAVSHLFLVIFGNN